MPNITDPLKHADWLELTALLSPGKQSSSGDLVSALKISSIFGPYEDEKIEIFSTEVFNEIEQRVKSAGHAYPFELKLPVLHARDNWEDYPAYIFCLCLSYFGWSRRHGNTLSLMFERLSSIAAKHFIAGNYVKGESVKFGFPRDNDIHKSFKKALVQLCTLIGEAKGGGESAQDKDGKLDIVAWRNFPDGMPGKLIMFGQCAAGNDWEDKISELYPDNFCKKWMIEQPASPLIRSFFMPHRVSRDRWRNKVIDGGIVFDRCRLAYWAHNANDYVEQMTWSKAMLHECGA